MHQFTPCSHVKLKIHIKTHKLPLLLNSERQKEKEIEKEERKKW